MSTEDLQVNQIDMYVYDAYTYVSIKKMTQYILLQNAYLQCIYLAGY